MRRIQQRSKTSGEGWFVTIGQRQQIGVAPHAGRTLRNAFASKARTNGFVIVENFQRRETLVTNRLGNISVRLAALATAQFELRHFGSISVGPLWNSMPAVVQAFGFQQAGRGE